MTRLLIAAVLGLVTALPASAQFQKPEDAIKYRQSVMFLMSTHLGRLNAMAQGRVAFDAKAAAGDAAVVSTLSMLPFAGYPAGSDKGAPNRARPEIWSDAAKFKAAGEKMQAEVVKLDAAAKSGNLDALKGAVGAVGGACKACHDDFRAERYSN